MTTSSKLLTADDLWNMPNHGGRNELVNGELRPMAPSSLDQGYRANRLAWRLGQFVEQNRLGMITIAEAGYRLAEEPATVVAPDIAFVCGERIPAPGRREKFFPGAPDLAVEVLSPSDSMVDVEEKVQAYLDAGTLLVWIVNPKRKAVTVHRQNGTVTIRRGDEALDGEAVIPGFSCPLSQIFADD